MDTALLNIAYIVIRIWLFLLLVWLSFKKKRLIIASLSLLRMVLSTVAVGRTLFCVRGRTSLVYKKQTVEWTMTSL